MISVTRTDVGKLRVNNQDALIVLEHLYGVADGMGGHKGGEVASAGARDGLEKFLKGKTPDPRLLKTAVEAVNRRLYLRQREEAELSGMGTTLTVLWAGEREMYLAHVGDSRAYLLREGAFTQVTRDHSLVQELVDQGVLTQEQAAHHPMRNVITRAVGTDETVEVDMITRERCKGDMWLLCSDGLSGMVSYEEMAGILREYAPEAAADRLLQAALDHGGRDNISFVILKDQEGAQ